MNIGRVRRVAVVLFGTSVVQSSPKKKNVRKVFDFFPTEFFAYNIDVGDYDGRMQAWCILLCLDIT